MYMRRFREAETSLDRAVALNPNDPFILSIRALLLNFVGRIDAALVEFEHAQRRDPFAVGWFEDFLGIILTGAGRYREALACFAKMATVQPWSLVYLTICHAELGETGQAEAGLAKLKAGYSRFPGMTTMASSKRKCSTKFLPFSIASRRACDASTWKNELDCGYGPQ